MGPAGWIEFQIHVTQVVFESQLFFYTRVGGVKAPLGERLDSQMTADSLSRSSVLSELKESVSGT